MSQIFCFTVWVKVNFKNEEHYWIFPFFLEFNTSASSTYKMSDSRCSWEIKGKIKKHALQKRNASNFTKVKQQTFVNYQKTIKKVSNQYFAYIFAVIIFNLLEIFSTIYAAVQTRKGKHVQFLFFGNITNLICKP